MAGIEEAFEKFSDRLAREESKRYTRDEQGDYREYLPEEQDQYPIKLGPLQLGANANIATGKFSPNEYQNVSTMNRNVGLRGRYDVPDSGIALLGSIGDVRSNQNVKTNLPFNPMTGEASPYSEMRKDVYKDSPYSVGAQYTPQGTEEMYSALYNKGGGYNLGYNKGPVNVSYTSNPGLGNNVMLRGQYSFADGGVASMFRERPGYQEGGFTDYLSNPLYQSFLQSPFYDSKVASSQVITPITLPSGQILNLPNAGVADQFKQYLSSTPAGGLPVTIPTPQRRPDDLREPTLEEAIARGEIFYNPITGIEVNPLTGMDVSGGRVLQSILDSQQQFMQQPQQSQIPQTQSPQLSYNEIQKANYARRIGELENKFANQGASSTKYIQDMTNLLAQMKTSGGVDPLGVMQSKYYTGPSSGSVAEKTGIDANFVINRAQQAEREAAARVTPKMADGGRVSMSDGGRAGSVEPFYINEMTDKISNPTIGGIAGMIPTEVAGGVAGVLEAKAAKGLVDTTVKLTKKEKSYLKELMSDTGGGKFTAEILEEVPSLKISGDKLIVKQKDLKNLDKYLQDLRISEQAPSGVGANTIPPRLRDFSTDNNVVRQLYRNTPGYTGYSSGGRVSMSDGGLTTTVPPDKGPDSQGVESLFRRRYN